MKISSFCFTMAIGLILICWSTGEQFDCTDDNCAVFCKKKYDCDRGRCTVAKKCFCDKCGNCVNNVRCMRYCQTIKNLPYGRCSENSATARCHCMNNCLDKPYCSVKCKFQLKCMDGFCVGGECQCLGC